jgi:hypothetical protein
MDQKSQVFAEEAIRALGRSDVPVARTSVALAFEVDHAIGPLADAVYLACAEIEGDGGVSGSTWNTLADAVDSSELFAVVEASRS